ncbi:MAG: hypothetical protein NTY53_19780 [Kiritimatiellaeota bacterium]|nr:hypothetical protein [Kiritimatiellota bacterium]
MKEEMHDEFLAIGKASEKAKHSPNTVGYTSDGHSSYFSTAVIAPRAMTTWAITGALKPTKVWLNGAPVTGSALTLKAGANPLVLQFDKPGRTFFVVSSKQSAEDAAPSVATADTNSDDAFSSGPWQSARTCAAAHNGLQRVRHRAQRESLRLRQALGNGAGV